jgi:hypothetical protein
MRGFWSICLYQAYLCEAVHGRGDLYGVTVHHPPNGDHGTTVLQVARSGPRGILLQCGPDLIAGHEHEERRQKDKTDHSRTKTLWLSPPHGYRMIALFPSRGPTSSREG